MRKTILLLTLILTVSIASAQFSIDVSGLKTDDYNPSEELTFKTILLENNIPISEEITYRISDAIGKKEITGTAKSDEETTIKIENDFLSGIWTITANYQDSQVERTFLVGENPEVEFLIENDELTIRNIGNVRYTKTLRIKIGDETNSYVQNIKAGDEKILKLISPEGTYDIEITDGETSIKREDIQLFGIGNVVEAIDNELVGYTGFAGAEDPQSLKDRPTALKKLPLALIFIAAIGILIALVVVERKLSNKK